MKWISFACVQKRGPRRELTLTAWIARATSTFVFPLRDFPFTPTISSPAWSTPSREAGVLSNTWTTYKQGQRGAPPPMLIPIKFCLSFFNTTDPGFPCRPLVAKRNQEKKPLNETNFDIKGFNKGYNYFSHTWGLFHIHIPSFWGNKIFWSRS